MYPRQVNEIVACVDADWHRRDFAPGESAHLIWCNANGRERIARFIDSARPSSTRRASRSIITCRSSCSGWVVDPDMVNTQSVELRGETWQYPDAELMQQAAKRVFREIFTEVGDAQTVGAPKAGVPRWSRSPAAGKLVSTISH